MIHGAYQWKNVTIKQTLLTLRDLFQASLTIPRPVSHHLIHQTWQKHKTTFTYARSSCGAETGRFCHSRCATADMFTHTWSGRICHFLRTTMLWSVRFRSGRGKLGVGPICCGADFAPAPPAFRDRVCVNACNDLCWSQFSTRLHPRPLRTCVNVP